jgi:hypothetical protein
VGRGLGGLKSGKSFARQKHTLNKICTRTPTIKLDQAVGFNLWALKAVLNGRGDEVVDLAVRNIIR